MIRAIPVMDDVPENYQEIIIVFAEVASARGKTGTMMNFSPSMLESLRAMPLDRRYRVIKQLCSGIEENLLQSSRNPTDNNIRVVGGEHTC